MRARSPALRHVVIDAEMLALADFRVVVGDPAEVEIQLLQEQDDIEFQFAVDFIGRRDAE
jgi:hypothetical protein